MLPTFYGMAIETKPRMNRQVGNYIYQTVHAFTLFLAGNCVIVETNTDGELIHVHGMETVCEALLPNGFVR